MPNSQALLDEWDRRKQANHAIRDRALKRLYSRRAVVDELIRSLENYSRFPAKAAGECVPIRKCS